MGRVEAPERGKRWERSKKFFKNLSQKYAWNKYFHVLQDDKKEHLLYTNQGTVIMWQITKLCVC